MRNTLLPTLIGMCIIGGTGGLVYWQQLQIVPAPVPQETGDIAQTEYSPADVAIHNTPADCWAIINGNVYDLTSWLPRHPGGERAIESLCGKDGSAAFNTQHGGGAAQQAILAGLKIGVIAQ